MKNQNEFWADGLTNLKQQMVKYLNEQDSSTSTYLGSYQMYCRVLHILNDLLLLQLQNSNEEKQ